MEHWSKLVPLSLRLQSVTSSSSRWKQFLPIETRASAETERQFSIFKLSRPLQLDVIASKEASVISRQQVRSSFCKLGQAVAMPTIPTSFTPWHLLKLSSFNSLHPLPIRLRFASPIEHPSSFITCSVFTLWRLENSTLLICHNQYPHNIISVESPSVYGTLFYPLIEKKLIG